MEGSPQGRRGLVSNPWISQPRPAALEAQRFPGVWASLLSSASQWARPPCMALAVCRVFVYSASRRWSAAGICSPGFLGPAPQDRAPASRPGPTPHLSPALQDRAGILHCTGSSDPPVGLCAPPRPRALVLHRHPAHVLPFVSLRLLSVLDHSTRYHCGTRKLDCPEFLVEPLTLPHGLEPTLGFLWPHCMFAS